MYPCCFDLPLSVVKWDIKTKSSSGVILNGDLEPKTMEFGESLYFEGGDDGYLFQVVVYDSWDVEWGAFNPIDAMCPFDSLFNGDDDGSPDTVFSPLKTYDFNDPSLVPDNYYFRIRRLEEGKAVGSRCRLAHSLFCWCPRAAGRSG